MGQTGPKSYSQNQNGKYEHDVGKQMLWILTRSDKNQATQALEMVRGLKFWIKEVEVLYYPASENKGTDRFHGYREADL